MADLIRESVVITGFVAVMMLLVEYANVSTAGRWQRAFRHGWTQYLLAALIAAIPGCLGAFSVVAMYTHGVLSLGAVVAAMIAASGDEAFVMLAIVPWTGLAIIALLVPVGALTGALVDALLRTRRARSEASCAQLVLHDSAACAISWKRIRLRWNHYSALRGVLMVTLVLFLAAAASGEIVPGDWNWIQVTITIATLAALVIVSTVPDHFLESHLWGHVMRTHVPRVFLWTFGALFLACAAGSMVEWSNVGQTWMMLVAACLIGLIPESGPHLVFVTLYAQQMIPFSVLLANSVVQDGHGMLPMLAHSRQDFLVIKGINCLAGFAIGTVTMILGY